MILKRHHYGLEQLQIFQSFIDARPICAVLLCVEWEKLTERTIYLLDMSLGILVKVALLVSADA